MGMSKFDPKKNKIVTYLLLTALMVITFISAIAINNGVFSLFAWLLLLVMNLGILFFISIK